jgi:arsenate reductase
MAKRTRILFLCTANSCRSQMAEGWTRKLHPDRFDACSAGTNPQGVNPLAVRVMAESGVDISAHTSRPINACDPDSIDVVVTVCDRASEACPVVPHRTLVLHQSFDDPPKLAAEARTDEEALPHYRRVRDEIRAFIEQLPDLLLTAPARKEP